MADGHHARTDGFTSLAVALGALGVAAGFDRADPIVGLIISVAHLRGPAERGPPGLRATDGRSIPHSSTTSNTKQATSKVAGTEDVRVRWVGHRLTAELTIVVPDTSVAEGHHIAQGVAARLRSQVRHLDHAVVHVHPLAHSRPASVSGP